MPLYLEPQEQFNEVPTIKKEDNELLRSLSIKTEDLPKVCGIPLWRQIRVVVVATIQA